MPNSILMNFYIPRHLKERMEYVCAHRHLTRTSFILTAIEPVIEDWERKMNDQSDGLNQLSQSYEDPPTFFYTDHGETNDW